MKRSFLLVLTAVLLSGFVVIGCSGDENVTYHVGEGAPDNGGGNNNGGGEKPEPKPEPQPEPEPSDPSKDMPGFTIFTSDCYCHTLDQAKWDNLDTVEARFIGDPHHDTDLLNKMTAALWTPLKEYIVFARGTDGGNTGGGNTDGGNTDGGTTDPATAGKTLFTSNCAGCHSGAMAPTAAELKGASVPTDGVHNTYNNKFTQEERDSIIAYFNSL
jgi:hypothetical protein